MVERPTPQTPPPAPAGTVAEAAQVYARQTSQPAARSRQPAPSPGDAAGSTQAPARRGRPGASLPTVRRGGYDKAAVDNHLRQLTDERQRLDGSLSQAQARIGELEAALEAARTRARGEQEPVVRRPRRPRHGHAATGRGGGRRGPRRALRDASEIREQAQRDAQATRADASREAEDMRLVQLKELDETRARIMADAEQERALARTEAADLKAAAQREADQVRLGAQQEANDLRVTPSARPSSSGPAADREVQEARRTLAVEKERLAREATEHHASATAETTRLVQEAEQRATAAEQRAREAMAQATSHREQAHTESEATLARARREAEQIVTSARTQADSVGASAQAEARARARQHPCRGRPDRQAPRRDHRPAGLAA